MSKKVFVSCGELSGENHALGVVKQLKSKNPKVALYGFASQQLKDAGVELLADYKEYSFSGITEVLSNLNKILEIQKLLITKLEDLQPDLVLLVDYGGFNLELAKRIKASDKLKNTKILEFIAPQLWASRPWRIKKIKQNIDKVLCTLPFEEEIYKKENIDVKYVGNPVLPSLTTACKKEELYELTGLPRRGFTTTRNDVLIGIFPGSRKAEIKEMLPRMLKAARELSLEMPSVKFKFLVSKAPSISYELFKKHGIEDYKDIVEVLNPEIENGNHKLLSAADALWLCSGTVTLEAALYETPYFLAYRSNLFNYILYSIFRVGKMAGLANIIQGRYIVKEFLQYDATANNFKKETKHWLRNDSPAAFTGYYYEIENNLKRLKDKLANYDSYELVADEVLKCLN